MLDEGGRRRQLRKQLGLFRLLRSGDFDAEQATRRLETRRLTASDCTITTAGDYLATRGTQCGATAVRALVQNSCIKRRDGSLAQRLLLLDLLRLSCSSANSARYKSRFGRQLELCCVNVRLDLGLRLQVKFAR